MSIRLNGTLHSMCAEAGLKQNSAGLRPSRSWVWHPCFRFPAPCWCFFSSVHLTHFLQGSGQRTGIAIGKAWFCVVFEVCVWIIVRLEDPNMSHYKISNRVSHFKIFYLLVFDRIHNAMSLNKMTRTSSRNIGPQYKKYSSIFHCTHGVLFIPVFTKHHLECLLLKSSFFTFIWP